MSATLFEGPAGSGKTTRLFAAVADHISEHALGADQRVLALTKMHGSRRRMHTKLQEVLGRARTFDCTTLNAFAIGLVRRWRGRAKALYGSLPSDTEFAAVAAVAAGLLEGTDVARWVAAHHPLLVVDELQDLRGTELAVVAALARHLHVLCAADEFQDLDPSGTAEAVAWAHAHGDVEPLTQVHRTDVAGLLAAAAAIRTGAPPKEGPGFKIFPAPTANVAAGFIARNLTWARGTEVALISPVGQDRSAFVRGALARLADKAFEKDGKRFGPFSVPWLSSTSQELKAWTSLLGADDDSRTITAEAALAVAEDLPIPLVEWIRRRRRLADQTEFSAVQIREQLGRAQSVLQSNQDPRHRLRQGLTVHQAKNREFDRVIVLWPVELGGDHEVRRRLLYNAITRAKRDCMVLVQDPQPKKGSRMGSPPFA